MKSTEQRKKRSLLIVYIAISIIVVLGTVLPFALPREDIISGTGMVKFVNLEGGFYGIIADSGIQYDPTNLDRNFEQDNLRVKFEGRIRSELVNTHQWGTILELTRIEKLP
ncbi:MAG: hypothetical protein Q7R50_00840 [Dehalococcoidales bacterium]|nr:hypothetical protein [Dehalococcoidales bacterium]